MDQPYQGEVEQLVLCIDVGTSTSIFFLSAASLDGSLTSPPHSTAQTAASVIHLQPSAAPKVRVVTRWPGAKNHSKIPSVIYYSKNGQPQAFGAEALEESVQVKAAEEEWTKTIHFKLWLHSSSMAPPEYHADPVEAGEKESGLRGALSRISISRVASGARENRNLAKAKAFELAPLPDGVPVERVYRDWFGYIFRSVKEWWCEINVDGKAIWDKLEQEMIFVLAHPNQWSTVEQGVLRSSLAKGVHAPVLGQPEGAERVVFVTEGEASVHFGLHYTSPTYLDSWLKVGHQFAVVDAGGSTIDTTTYEVDAVLPKLTLREIKPSGCVQGGAIFPTRDFRAIVTAKLSKSKYGAPEYIDDIVAQFDVKTKCSFVNENDAPHIIKFGFDRDSDKTCGISRGRLTLTGQVCAEVAKAFKSSLDLMMESVAEQLEGTNVKTIFLSGGFGESPALQHRIREQYPPSSGIQVITTDEPSKKGVGEGAALYYVREAVVARAARYSFGTDIGRLASRWPKHLLNVGTNSDYHTYFDLDGLEYQNGAWSSLLKKGKVMETDEVVATSYYIVKTSVFYHTVAIWACETEMGTDGEMIDKHGKILPKFKHICDVKADLSVLQTESNKRRVLDRSSSSNPQFYWHMSYKIEMMFGGTSLKARLS